MKQIIAVCMCALLASTAAAQDTAAYRHMFRYFFENDFINLAGKGTDNEYTGGMSFDYYYVKDHRSRFFLDRWMPKAGSNAINTFGIRLMQVGFTPDDISKANPNVDDYPYAGGLFLIHSLRSDNPVKKFNIQTEVIAGLIGPYSYAAETQEAIHRWIHYKLPQGWDHQMPTDVLLNVNISGETMLWNPRRWLETGAGATVKAGTMEDAATVYGILRIGKMYPYFNGLLPQYGSPRSNKPRRFQLYAFARPGLYLTAYNAFVDGGVFAGKPDYYKQTENDHMPYTTDHKVYPVIDAGLQLAWGKIGFGVTQRIMSPLLNGYPPHAVGNFALTVSW